MEGGGGRESPSGETLKNSWAGQVEEATLGGRLTAPPISRMKAEFMNSSLA